MRFIIKLLALASSLGLLSAATASAAEPNEGYTTATGPLTAGKTFNASLETINDVDFQFFYLPESTQMSITTINAAKKKDGGLRGRTIVSALQQARKGKLPLPVVGTDRVLGPGDRATVEVSLVPGKYFIPVVRAPNGATPQPDVPFKLRIGPVGSTTDSFEIFERRCKDALSKVRRIKSSKKSTAKRLERAKKGDAPSSKVEDLKDKLRSKRNKIDDAQRLKRIVCSVPM